MRRREFITLLIAQRIAWPNPLGAQQPHDQMPRKLPRIGFLTHSKSRQVQVLFDAFHRGLLEHGYVEGQNLLIEYRFWQGNNDLLAKFAAELVADGVDLIVAPTTPEALAAHAATSTIPIVTITAVPVAVGLAASLARPGGNVTGMTSLSSDPSKVSKGFGLLIEVLPGASRFAMLMDPDNQLHAQLLKAAYEVAAQRHLSILPVVKRTADDIGPAFETMTANGVEGLVVFGDPIEFPNRRTIIELAAKHRIPALYPWREEAVDGGLLAYGVDIVDLNRRAAAYVAKLLQGVKAAELPIEQPDRYSLVINLKTAKTLGLTLPPSLLALADEVIE
jgi:putative tryptophan/tyrosine transport system substrate-binding protein